MEKIGIFLKRDVLLCTIFLEILYEMAAIKINKPWNWYNEKLRVDEWENNFVFWIHWLKQSRFVLYGIMEKILLGRFEVLRCTFTNIYDFKYPPRFWHCWNLAHFLCWFGTANILNTIVITKDTRSDNY